MELLRIYTLKGEKKFESCFVLCFFFHFSSFVLRPRNIPGDSIFFKKLIFLVSIPYFWAWVDVWP